VSIEFHVPQRIRHPDFRFHPESTDKDHEQAQESQKAEANDRSNPDPSSAARIEKDEILAAHKIS
jgi:hypothetical protein